MTPAPAAVVRVSGPACDMILKVLTGREPVKRMSFAAALKLSLGEVPAQLWLFKSPASATGEDVLEFRVPGQADIIRALATRLNDLGCRNAQPGEFTLRALRAGKLDLSRAEAVMALIAAQDDASRNAALRALSGEAATRAKALAERLRELSARYELAFDFAEDEPAPPDTAALRTQAAAIAQSLKAEAGGERATHAGAVRAALFGPPNAGKSSLLNALVGATRALTSPLPGTTRDAVVAQAGFDGSSVELADLSGVGKADADLGRFAAKSRDAAASADILLLLCAPGQSDDLSAEFRSLCERDAGIRARALWVYTMTDLSTAPSSNPLGLEQAAVSAVSGAGLAELRTLIAARARECAGSGPHSRLQLAESAAAETLAITADVNMPPEAVATVVRNALRLIDDALFSDTPGDVLDLIFSRFCIGK
ncbi:MAG: 50S ribosome-binding GTPase [Planctomycetes bacterium]|nr:50S ribosome-binding GTPase [Planctomycetota bacterium]